MNELQEMQSRIAQLEKETLALKLKNNKQSGKQRFVAVLAIAGIGLALVAQKGITQSTNQKTLVCSKLQIVDPDNKVVGNIGVSKDGEGYVSLFNGSYKKTVMIGATNDTGAGGVWVYDEKGKLVSSLGSSDGKGTVWTQK